MIYHENIAGADTVTMTLTEHEADQLERFIHLASMCLMTWPIVAGDYMTERKAARERRSQGSDPPAA
ncbi:hypothetical protein J2X12_002919 [Pseudarthrobacter oxydans]|uniref:Uncharacterized protein n=1 Tax=Pseudarthrobacter oxydans TaxID=1671 RepID=A0AAW8NBI8_PSEOX|nr:hypothetical protein [Pseudarthrobacter oxydans]MDR6794344.1 hypothetical protein [Pseudarthrobacter oxydans]MDR7164881.1 hypothetical protein [Pseudarthrobacter oxydans]